MTRVAEKDTRKTQHRQKERLRGQRIRESESEGHKD